MTEHEILVAARALIADPERWTQAVFSRDANGKEVAPTARAASCWCAEGAVIVASNNRSPTLPALDFLEAEMDWDIAYFNDTHGHAEVLAAFDAAIAETAGV